MKKLLAALLVSTPVLAQQLSAPPGGDNQRATVTQQVGPVTVSIEYSSPRVIRNGVDRRGKIWGTLVPYGMSDIGFNNCKSCPWRAGANENTVFTASNDLKVQGQPLKAGRYGLHMIPGKEAFTVIFSRNSTSWGSFFYDPSEDALRVEVKPAKSAAYHEWLTYEFTEREPAKAVVALQWEELSIPIAVSVDNVPQLYAAKMREELRGTTGFDWHAYQQAADYAVKNKVALADATVWANNATSPAYGGDANFNTLMTLSRVQAANGKTDEAAKTEEKALHDPSVKPLDLHLAGRALLAEGKKDQAMKIFQLNAQRFPDQWPVHVGLMRGYAALGDNNKALAEAKLAVKQAPDEGNRKNLEGVIQTLQAGKKID
jgi:predicted negative regulator of RcsB-dependent stress response